MKRYKFIHLWLLVTMLLLTVSCTNDDVWESQETPVKGFVVGFDTGNEAFTRAEVASDGTLNEATVDHADIFIFNGNTGTLIKNCYWHLTPADMEENQSRSKTLLDGDWKNTVLNGTDYDVYVIANIHSTSDLSSVSSVTDLQTLIEQDNEVYKVYNETKYPNKFFTMIGKVEGFNPHAPEVGDEYILPVELKRLAAKIEINLSFSKDFAERYSSTNVEARLRNYGVNAPILEESDAVFDAERASMSGYERAYQYNYKENTAKLILYTYPTEWEADMLKETFVAVNIPVIDLNKPEGDPERFLNTNYYKISLRGADNEKRLERNHLYRVDAVINMLGSYIPDEPVPLKEVKYAALNWENVPVNIDGGSPRYLVLSENTIIMKNVSTSGNQQTFTSSSFLKASGDNSYAVELLTDVQHTFTYDKYGVPQKLSNNLLNQIQSSVQFDKNILSGTITINSPIPENNGVRYMTFRVTNSQGSSADFLAKQYPLEYVTSTQGVKGYRADGVNNGDIYRTKTVSRVNDDGTSQIKYSNGEKASLNNARMYHIMITSTGGYLDEEDNIIYTLANPLIDSNGYTVPTQENTDLVAPSFMIASQLGASYTMSYSNAQKQCNQYREVTKVKQPDGTIKEVTFSGWRLPTLAELKIINKFQGVEGSAIDVVLTGTQYWYAYEEDGYWLKKHFTYNPQKNTTKSNSEGNVRCVRTSSELMAD